MKFSVKPVDLSTENNSSKPDTTLPRPYGKLNEKLPFKNNETLVNRCGEQRTVATVDDKTLYITEQLAIKSVRSCKTILIIVVSIAKKVFFP